MFLDDAATPIQHLQKGLALMNAQLSWVVTDINSVTGIGMVRTIVNGQRNPAVRAELRDPRYKTSEATIQGALKENCQPEPVFAVDKC